MLTGCAEAQARLQGYRERGIISGDTSINWGNLIKFKQLFTNKIPENKEQDFAHQHIEMYHGKAKFVEHNKLEIGDQIIASDIVVIAAGAAPRKMNIPGEEYLTTSDEFMDLPELPADIVFLGGGYVSFELADVANQAGAKVTILERSSRPLAGFEPDLVNLLANHMKDSGIEIKIDTGVVSIKKRDHKYLVEVESGKIYTTDMVVHGAGRVPQIQELGLHNASVHTDAHGIILNPHLQSVSNPSIYVAGDSVGDPESLPLTPVASLEARTVIHNILNTDKQTPDYTGTASVLYTFPPLARVGMLETEAKADNIDYLLSFADTSDTLSTKRLALKVSAFKIVIREDNLQILGAHLLGHHADEVINLFALAIRNGFTVEKLKDNLWSFPSVSDVLDDMLKLN